ncbi:AAA family ATPase [Aliivibrio logei]|uniref:AAA family ATPase n=1 Tax=Aliivibrio logei TaxID=688 RepID=UPI0003AABF37|nr:AAA family ATPase [Aliivibrio logei]
MTIKLKNLIIENFKVFSFIDLPITTQNLALLDGPNGFGKTSFYDALELLFLGCVSRYTDLEDKAANKRRNLRSFPLLHDGAKSGDKLSIRAEIETESGILYLERSATKEALDNVKSIAAAKFNLYRLDEHGESVEIYDEQLFWSLILGDNYKKDFGLFHYIEQEENTSILKSKGEDKQTRVDHLFDVGDYREKIAKLAKIQKSIATLKTPKKKQELQVLESQLTALRKDALPENTSSVKYDRLVMVTEQPWDKETVDFISGTYAEWVSQSGVLARIKALRENATHFFNDRHNRIIKNRLAPKPEFLEALLKFAHRLEDIPQYKQDLLLYQDANRYLDSVRKGLVNLVNKNIAVPTPSIIEKLPDDFNLEGFKAKLEDLKATLKSSSDLSKSLTKLRSSRTQYIKDYEDYQKSHGGTNSTCPTCGYDWLQREKLLSQVDKQEGLLQAILDSNSSILQSSISLIEVKYLAIIKLTCEDIVQTDKVNIAYKDAICQLDDKQISNLKILRNNFYHYKVELSKYYLKSFELTDDIPVGLLIVEVESLYKLTDNSCIATDFDDLFTSIFNDNEDALLKLDLKELQSKVEYLKQQYVQSKLKEIEAKEINYKNEKRKYDNAILVEKDLKELIGIYNDNVNNYIETISKGIEILFHIYSGRLLQNFHNGLGVFIESDGKSISFRDDPNRDRDVIFSMSSGQLSSLVIAFTMALNHKYAKNPLIMIDDPVQTMDEINIAGFIDLLRHEFRDRQIFLSTHEDNISSYIRYKFGKANLETQRINFKKISYL